MVLRSVSATEAWRPLRRIWDFLSLRSFAAAKRGSGGIYLTAVVRTRDVTFWNGIPKLRCSRNETPSSKSEEDELDQGPPQKKVDVAFIKVSKKEGRVGQTTNVVIGGTVADDSTNEWLALDQKVNSYPTVRGFIAIGTGGDDFAQAMVVAVESVLQQPIPEVPILI
ncbi:Oxidoreductase, 2OG-Fe(II) oxygenase family protein [Hibiscus syriacus]|uniref:Oxidoreductase, 2OG-Fe(II) oxygenase family protein n=1 Tax=Hibiscus syriacus TaxID=106335 RepID=A0A6A2Z5X6_HIBSY|nr:Oxidoreductase, 2OG-Fe(II) oxygenase family protein [Hibiscus syriacus]